MKTRDLRIASAILDTATSGRIELTGDWHGRGRPHLRLSKEPHQFLELHQVPDYHFGLEAGFFSNRKGHLYFVFDPERYPDLKDWQTTPVYVAGGFNGWQHAVGREEWRLQPDTLAGRPVLMWSGRDAGLLGASPPHQFKFVTGEHRWLDVPSDAPNVVHDGYGIRNLELTPHRTGGHRFTFTLARPLDLSLEQAVILSIAGAEHATDLQPGRFFFELHTELPLGAIVADGATTFRLFAPRAQWVKVAVFDSLESTTGPGALEWRPLARLPDGAWELRVPEDLHGRYYWYRLDGPRGRFSGFNPEFNILDPWALAVVDRQGPAIVIDPVRMAIRHDYFKPPAWQDLVVCEAHVRDLLAKSPILADPVERRTFAGLTKFLDHKNCYFKKLGINAVELQPIQEFDNATPEEYGWGYMPVNYFSPESSYGRDPARASHVTEFQQCVEAFHRNGFAVILDVVYNHVGEPNHLFHIDRLYYFEAREDGTLANWSGCGNDLRFGSAMVRRLVIDSLQHLVRFYGVDGFRFDLAELLGVEALREVEAALKRTRPDIILIAEPWSFRGHIAGALRDTGYASWNDGYRDFIASYVRGQGSFDGAAYFLRGSPWYFAKWPAQTVNYAESHDNRVWIDKITENGEFAGHSPTANDIRRTHLMIAFLMVSIGIPMIQAGQDFLRSKHGHHDSYQRGDLNALDYRRLYRFPGTHAYFAAWIRFRLGRWGRMFRHFSRPEEGFLHVMPQPESNALAAVYNAAGSLGPMRVLFAINPHLHDLTISIGEHGALPWQQVADHERFFPPGETDTELPIDGEIFLPGLGCGLWIAGG